MGELPEMTAAHRWGLPPWAGGTTVLYVCAHCGIVRRADGANKPCRGPVKVETREPIEPAGAGLFVVDMSDNATTEEA